MVRRRRNEAFAASLHDDPAWHRRCPVPSGAAFWRAPVPGALTISDERPRRGRGTDMDGLPLPPPLLPSLDTPHAPHPSRIASAVLMLFCLAGATLWALPILAVGLISLLRYSFGSLFVVGESVASALLRTTGADIAGTLQRLQAHPWAAVAASGVGLAACVGAAALAFTRPGAAALLAAASAAWAWHQGLPLAAAVLVPACLAGIAGFIAARP